MINYTIFFLACLWHSGHYIKGFILIIQRKEYKYGGQMKLYDCLKLILLVENWFSAAKSDVDRGFGLLDELRDAPRSVKAS